MDWLYAIAVLGVLLISLVYLRYRTGFEIGVRLRSRLLMGIPWGTLIASGIVLFVYFFVQSAWGHRYHPVVIPFQSWSYTYPVGWLTSGFAHSGFSHMLNNLTATLILGTLAEYAFSHFPQRRGAMSFGSYTSNPYVRAFVIVPLGIIAIGLFSALFALGPVIGFSGVVFAFAGFALIRYPIGAVLALFGISAMRRLYDALQSPTVTRGFVEPGPSPPWWAEVSIQGHAIGFLVGVLLGIYIFRRRETIADAWRIWAGVFLFAVAQNLWAVYWFEGTDRYILFQGLGFVLIVALALLVATGATSTDRTLIADISRRQLAVGILAIALALMIGPAVAVNLITTDPGAAADRPGVEVDDYRVIYAENIENRMVAVGDIDIGGLADVRTSGVIVYSDRHDIWTRAVSSSRLASNHRASVRLGGVGWRTTVFVQRPTWSVVGNASVYQVWLQHDDDRVMGFASGPSTADVQVANHTVTLLSEDEAFQLRVDHDGETIETVAIPDRGESVDIGEVTIERIENRLKLRHNGTNVTFASLSS